VRAPAPVHVPVPVRSVIELPVGLGRAGGDVAVTFVGTATTLLELGPFRLLTDPNFLQRGQRAYIGMGLATKRLTEPAMRIEELPPLDAVVLSHYHGDHFDRVAALGLDHELPVITDPRAARKLSRRGFRRAIALPTWSSQELRRGAWRCRATSLPGKHAPRPLGLVVPPVMGTMLELLDGERLVYRVYVTGDTLPHDGISEIARRYPSSLPGSGHYALGNDDALGAERHGIDCCIIHLGGTRLAGVLLTMDGRQGVEALRTLAPRVAVPVHYDDYRVFKSPLSDFVAFVAGTDLVSDVRCLARGETFRYPLARAA